MPSVEHRVEDPVENRSSVENHYRTRLARHQQALAAATRRSSLISLARLMVFFSGAASAGAFFWYHGSAAGGASLLLLATFVGLVMWHARVADEEERTQRAITFCEQGLARHTGDLAALPARGERFRTEAHPYAEDLDLFGSHAVLQLLDGMGTAASEERLAHWLRQEIPLAEALQRQKSVLELRDHPELREQLFVLAHRAREHGDRTAFPAWCERPSPSFPVAVALLGVGVVAVTLLLFGLLAFRHVPSVFWSGPFFLGLLANRLAARASTEAFAAATSGAAFFRADGALLRALTRASWTSPALTDLVRRLTPADVDAPRALERLARLADLAEARQNAFFNVFLAPFVAFDVFVGFALARWHRAYGAHVAGWIDALADALALAGLGTFAFEQPAFTFPTLHDGSPEFIAAGLSHPLLPPTARVGNNVTLQNAGTALLVTGSNMSGKSTLLRSLGVAVVLGRMGAPVCASSCSLTALTLRTSIRIRDSLAAGVSHFYAELHALHDVVVAVDQGATVFFLLDEILHGTNSRERNVGAKSVIRYLLDHGALGAVSTHDLGLTDLAADLPGRIQLVHFLEKTRGESMTFDYQLRQGVLASGNALQLMRNLGLPVPPEDEVASV